MRILVTNDDGIFAPGIQHLAKAMEGLGEIVVVAPDQEFSGAGAAIGPMMTLASEATARPSARVTERVITRGVSDGPRRANEVNLPCPSARVTATGAPSSSTETDARGGALPATRALPSASIRTTSKPTSGAGAGAGVGSTFA